MNLNTTEIVTEPCRLAFPALFEPKPVSKNKPNELKYQAALLLPPDYDLKPLGAVVKAAMLAKWGKVIELVPRNRPLKKCEDRDQEKPLAGYDEGWKYLNAKSGYLPAVLDQNKQEILTEDRIFAGCWCRFHLTAYAWEHPEGGKGVSFSLNAVQLVREDARLGGRKDAREVFGSVEVEDLEVSAYLPDETGGEAGSAGGDELDELFG
jgi:hypothetical protein